MRVARTTAFRELTRIERAPLRSRAKTTSASVAWWRRDVNHGECAEGLDERGVWRNESEVASPPPRSLLLFERTISSASPLASEGPAPGRRGAPPHPETA